MPLSRSHRCIFPSSRNSDGAAVEPNAQKREERNEGVISKRTKEDIPTKGFTLFTAAAATTTAAAAAPTVAAAAVAAAAAEKYQ